MKTLLSLFDYSGNWAAPFAAGGWDVVQWDIKLSEFMDINLLDCAETVLERFENVDGILAAPPCTDFSNSGAQYWPAKDADGRTAAAVQMVNQVQKLADLFTPTDPDFDGTFFWAAENPVGRIGKLTGLSDPFWFNPWEYAGHLNPTKKELKLLDQIRQKNGANVTSEENDLVMRLNAYTKKTGLWGRYNRNLVKKPIPAVKVCAQGSFTQRLGGKSDLTKEIRSFTPMGFAQAFFEANNDWGFVKNNPELYEDYE